MKKFSELTTEQMTSIINGSKKLRDELENYICDMEMYWIEEKINCVKDSLCNWSVGFWEPNYLNVDDYESFVEGVEESIICFGGSDNLKKKVAQCQKLIDTNLFEYHARQLKEIYLAEEIQPICDYVEACRMELYYGKVGEKCSDYIVCFASNYDDYLYDEESRTYYEPVSLTA